MRKETLQERVIRALSDSPEPMSHESIRRRVHASGDCVRRAIRQLGAGRQIELAFVRQRPGTTGTRYWRLAGRSPIDQFLYGRAAA